MPRNNEVMKADALAKLIGTIGRQKVRIDAMTQTAAVQCIAQSIVHRNSTPATQLFDVLGKSTRRDALVAYFERFGNLMWSKVESKVVFCDVANLPSRTKLEWTDEYAAKVAEVVWFNAKPEPKIKSNFDVEDAVSKLIETIERNIKKGVDVKNSALYDDVAAAYYRYRAGGQAERAEQAAFKGATLTQLVERHGCTPDQARELLAKVKDQQKEETPAAPEAGAPATDEQVGALAEHFNGTKPDLKVANG